MFWWRRHDCRRSSPRGDCRSCSAAQKRRDESPNSRTPARLCGLGLWPFVFEFEVNRDSVGFSNPITPQCGHSGPLPQGIRRTCLRLEVEVGSDDHRTFQYLMRFPFWRGFVKYTILPQSLFAPRRTAEREISGITEERQAEVRQPTTAAGLQDYPSSVSYCVPFSLSEAFAGCNGK